MTPTLKQLWVTVRQLQQDMQQAKNQINEERALRSHLQQLLQMHLESSAVATTAAATVSGALNATAAAAGVSTATTTATGGNGTNIC